MSIQGIQSVIQMATQAIGDNDLPPIHLWNPPYCGDIGLRITSDGQWYYDNSPIGRKKLARLFSRILRYEDDGCYYLVTPVEKILVTVEDVPFLVVLMETIGQGQKQTIKFTTNMDDIFQVDEKHPLRFEIKEDVPRPYVLVRGKLEALINRAVFYDLIALGQTHIVEGDKTFGVWSGGIFFPIMKQEEMDRII